VAGLQAKVAMLELENSTLKEELKLLKTAKELEPVVNRLQFLHFTPFKELSEINQLFNEMEEYRTKGKKREKLPLIDSHFLFIVMLWTGLSYKCLHSLIREGFCHTSSLKRSLMRWEMAAEAWSANEGLVKFPTVEEWVEQSSRLADSEFQGNVAMFLDGTVLPRFDPRSNELRKKLYNSKHGYSSWSFFISVTASGQIAYLSKVQFGSLHDATALRRSNFFPSLKEQYQKRDQRKHPPWTVGYQYTRYQVMIGADKGYRAVIPPPGIRMVITKTGTSTAPDASHGESEKNSGNEFNPAVAKFRAVVERAFQKMKRWTILSSKYHVRTVKRTNRIVHIVAGLVNRMIVKLPNKSI